jgi:hypothetical protein
MKKRVAFEFTMVIFFVLILCSGCSASECPEGGYVEYKPVFGNPLARSREEMYVIDESRVDAEHYDNIKIIFEYYKIKYKVVGNKVMVDCRVWKDKDSMANLTKKADDKDFIEQARQRLQRKK